MDAIEPLFKKQFIESDPNYLSTIFEFIILTLKVIPFECLIVIKAEPRILSLIETYASKVVDFKTYIEVS